MATKTLTRRKFLKVAGVTAGAAAAATAANPGGLTSLLAAPPSALPQTVFPFANNQVTLNTGTTAPFIGNRDRENSYLTFLDNDRMLYNFRVTSGLSTNGAAALGGWDAPTVLLRGHSTGHYLKALAQAYAGGGGSSYLTKINYMVTELGKCQDANPGRGYNVGYLAGYPETQFDQLEDLTTYPTIWAPWYTCHKIMAGLLACYQLAGSAQALTIVTKMADWAYNRLSVLSASLRAQMWALYIAGEYGGMNETMAEIHAITNNPNHLTCATYFDNTNFFNSLAANSNVLNGKHANQHIPQITGALKIYDRNNNSFYYDVAYNFWEMVVNGTHCYAYGGTGVGESFKAVNVIGTQLVSNASESCATYNMLKLTRNLFYHNPVEKYMGYYEKALYNHILANQNQGAAHGPTTYFMPTQPGGSKGYSNDYSNFTCCHGTGMESPTKFQDTIYASNGDTLYVNLFIPSTLNWTSRSITVTQATSFPAANTTQLTIGGSGHIDLKIRVPTWVQSGWQVTVNGVVQSITPTPGSYATIDRTWANGDVVVVTMPMGITIEASPDVANTRVVKYGPLVLCCAWTTSTLPTLTPSTITSTGTLQWSASVNGATTTLVPFYTKYSGAYTIYFNITSTQATNTPTRTPTRTNTPGGPTNTPTQTNTPGGPTNTPTRTPTQTNTPTQGPTATPTNTSAPGAGPIHRYQFEGNANDTGSAVANGTLVNSPTFTTGRVGQAVNLAGGSGGSASQHVSLPAGIVNGLTNFTVATWVKLDTTGSWRRVFDFGAGTTTNMFLVPTSGSTIRFAITTSGSGGEQRINGTAALPTGVWKHVAVTRNGNTGTLYVDGVQVGTNTSMTLSPSNLGNTTNNWLGRSQYSGDAFLDGQIDEFRIYNYALTASEVLSLFQNP